MTVGYPFVSEKATIILEEQGKLDNTFTQPFRRRKPWRIPWPRAASNE